jgi:hypothetical protein
MKKLNYLVGLGLLVAWTAPAVDLSKLPPASARKDVTFEKDIKPLFEASCVKCHGAEKPKAGLRLDSLDGVLKGGKEGKVLEAGKSEKSPLVIAISHLDPEMAMPPKPKPGRGPGGPGGPGGGTNNAARGPGGPGGQRGPGGPPPKPLTAEQVGLVRAWIDAGAK